MGSMPLALSVHNFISSVGADAGFAAIIGLAILVLLYFAHARDTANLQREAEELSHRLLQAETRIAQLSRQPQPAAQTAAAAPAPAPATRAARPVTGAPIRAARAGAGAVPLTGAPAGVGAPALAAATRVVPVSSPSAPPSEPPAPVEAEPDPAVAQDDELAFADPGQELAPAQAARAMAASAPVRERGAGPVAPSPATAAGAANGGGEGRVAAPPSPRPRPASPPRERVQIRAGTAPGSRRPPGAPRGPVARGEGGSGRRFALLLGALVAIAAIAALVIITQGGSTGGKPGSAASSTTNAPRTRHGHAAAAFNPASVTVAVLNGTATNQLAHTVSAKLSADGYKQGDVATAANQTQTSTVVAFLPGARTDALHVATALKLGPASVQPIDSSTQSVACPPPSACTANVVVTVGQDLATL
jgi:hypothetical protein